jgi:hypothetical protein
MKRQRASRSSKAQTSRGNRRVLPNHSKKIGGLPTLMQVSAAGTNPAALPPPPLKPVSMLRGGSR